MIAVKFTRSGYDIVVATNVKEAIQHYSEYYVGNVVGYIVTIMSDQEMKDIYLTDINEAEPDPEEVDYNEDDYMCGYKIIETLDQYVKRSTHTHLIETEEE